MPLLLLIVVIAGLGAWLVVRSGSGDGALADPTIWQQITDGITDGAVPKDVALEAFAYAYGVSMPGVTVPAGRDAGAPSSGTEVTRWVLGDWKQLSAQQQAVVARYVPGGAAAVSAAQGSAQGPALASRVGIAEPTTTQNAPPAVGAPRAAAGNPDADALTAAFTADLDADLHEIGAKLGLRVMDTQPSSAVPASLAFLDEDGGNTLMTTYFENDRGTYAPCQVRVWRNAWQNEQLVAGAVSPRIHVLLTHEAVHCYQQELWADIPTNIAMPAWISEGTAAWLAASDTGIAEHGMDSWWRNGWFYEPEKALTNRTYDAYGYFALLDHLGRNLWSVMASGWRAAGSAAGSRSDAFIAPLNGDADDVRDAWAPSFARRTDFGDPWIAYGFGLPADVAVLQRAIQATGGGWNVALPSRSNIVDQVTSSAGEIVSISGSGLASAHDEAGHSDLASETMDLCTVTNCVCPPGSLRAGEDLAPQHMQLPFTLAVNAPNGGSASVVTGRRLADACGQSASAAPTAAGGAGPTPGTGSGGTTGVRTPDCGATGCAGDNGDPHLTTVDGQHYDFQAAGEFVLLRSPDGATEIQGRQEPYGTSGSVSINTAIAMRVGSHHVAIHLVAGGQQLLVDGRPSSGPSTVLLAGGGSVARIRDGFEIDFPDGTRAWTLSVGTWGINVQVSPSAALRSSATGILGRITDRTTGLPPLPNGSSLQRVSDRDAIYQRLYGTFATAWRVTDTTTLFDDDAGSSVARFDKAGFPTESAPLSISELGPTALASGLTKCAAIADAELRQECAFDVGITGDTGFSTLYMATEPADRSPGATPSPIASPAGASAPLPPGIGTVLDGVDAINDATLGPDNHLYTSVVLADGSFQVLAVAANGAGPAARTTIPDAGKLAFADGSIWVGMTLPDGGCGIDRLDPATLAVQATTPVTCLLGNAIFAARGQWIWFVDTTTMDTDLKGAVLRGIDPATNQPGTNTVPIPAANGYFIAGQGDSSVLVVSDSETSFLPSDGSAFLSLGPLEPPIVFGVANGGWIWDSQADTATLFGPNGSLVTLPETFPILGADASAVYASGGPGSPATSTLWRYPIDGSTGRQIASGAELTTADGHTSELGYFDDWPFLVGDHLAVKLWLPFSSVQPDRRTLDLQWIPLP